MYAIIETGGKQYKVKQGDIIEVELLDAKKSLTFDKVLFCSDGKDKVEIGTPYVKGAKIQAIVEKHGKDKKIIIFKYKKRKGYRRKQGHRQQYSLLRVEKITGA